MKKTACGGGGLIEENKSNYISNAFHTLTFLIHSFAHDTHLYNSFNTLFNFASYLLFSFRFLVMNYK